MARPNNELDLNFLTDEFNPDAKQALYQDLYLDIVSYAELVKYSMERAISVSLKIGDVIKPHFIAMVRKSSPLCHRVSGGEAADKDKIFVFPTAVFPRSLRTHPKFSPNERKQLMENWYHGMDDLELLIYPRASLFTLKSAPLSKLSLNVQEKILEYVWKEQILPTFIGRQTSPYRILGPVSPLEP